MALEQGTFFIISGAASRLRGTGRDEAVSASARGSRKRGWTLPFLLAFLESSPFWGDSAPGKG